MTIDITNISTQTKRTSYDFGLRKYLISVYQIYGTVLKWIITFASLGMGTIYNDVMTSKLTIYGS